jgi:peptide-methionine (S)-S-oxide reductase
MKKGIIYIICFLSLLFSYTSCSQNNKPSDQLNLEPISVNKEKVHKAYFASGCFWCVEAIYESIIGVNDVVSGYSGGEFSNPTYQLVNTKLTGHAETIEVTYNPEKITFSNLVDVYFGSQNIEQINGQGPDRGPQYRSIIFYQNKEQKNIIDKKILELEFKLNVKVAAEVYPFRKFWIAETYHQDFKKNNTNHPYIINISNPRFENFKYKFEDIIKD